MFPLAGALIGGTVGGPIGLIAGAKLGGLAAIGGGVIGEWHWLGAVYTQDFNPNKTKHS